MVLLLIAIFWPTIQRMLAPRERIRASIVGFFPQVDDAVTSVRRLRAAGFTENRLTVLSSIPYPEEAFGTDTGSSRIRRFAFVGGVLGALTGIALVAGTSLAYPLPTGGKSIVTAPITLVIGYEFTVLFTMLFSLFRFLYEARLPGYGGKLYDRRISEGMIGVIVRCETEEQARQAEQTVSTLGASETRRVEGRVA